MGRWQRYAICTALLTVLCLAIGHSAIAHGGDVTLAELREQPAGSYELRIGLPDALATSTLAPQLPARCQLSSGSPTAQSSSSTVRLFAFSCGDKPLTNRDKLSLPWRTEGGVVTVYWQDGLSKTQFLAATADGVVVPIGQFQIVDGRWIAQLRQDAISGMAHITAWPHLLFLGALAFWSRFRRLIRSITFFIAGGLLSVVVVSVSGITASVLVAETGLILATVALAAMGVWRKSEVSIKWIGWPLLALGLLHGLGWASLLVAGGTPLPMRLLVLNVGMDAAQLLTALVIVSGKPLARRLPARWRQGMGYGLVGLAVVTLALPQTYRGPFFLTDLPTAQLTASQQNSDITTPAEPDNATASNTANPSLATSSPIAETSTPLAARENLSTPIEIFVTVEPLEIRSEVLVDVSTLITSGLIESPNTTPTLTVAAQETFKQQAVQPLTNQLLLIRINGTAVEPTVDQINFVVLDEQGILIRETPAPENLDEATLGVVLSYPTDNFPETLAVEWTQFSSALPEIATTINDPQNKTETVLTTDEPTLDWQNNLTDISVPAIEAIGVNANSRTIPIISLALILVALGLDSGRLKFKKTLSLPLLAATRTVLPLAIWAYPIMAFPLVMPPPFQPQPSSNQVALILDQLLSNVYESFEFRTEDEIYDKLAISVEGEQLADIYLENRRALEVENRGGARASVDYVDVTEIGDVYSLPNKEVFVQAEWIVGGSVTHFGHTHYRNNLYVALITLTYTDAVWKIKHIEVVDEHRLS